MDFDVINKFAFLKISPPIEAVGLDEKIDEIKKKIQEYNGLAEEKIKD